VNPLKISTDEVAPLDVESFIRAAVNNLKSGKFGGALTERKEGEAIRELITMQFARDLIESMEQSVIPEFRPFPPYPQKVDSSTSDNALSRKEPIDKMIKGEIGPEENGAEESTITSEILSLLTAIQDVNMGNLDSESLLSWYSSVAANKDGGGTEIKRRWKRWTSMWMWNVDQMTRSIVNDMRNLFNTISLLDISRCAEKMVCEIHSRAEEFTPRHFSSNYEANIITIFRYPKNFPPPRKIYFSNFDFFFYVW